MLFNPDRDTLRNFFLEAWQKHQQQLPLEPLEQQIVNLILQHPEYQPLFANPDLLTKDYSPEMGETNPFLHLSLHQTILEQISTDNPRGITNLYQQIVKKFGDVHHAEHQIMEVLIEMLWQVMRYNQAFDEQGYLNNLTKLLNK